MAHTNQPVSLDAAQLGHGGWSSFLANVDDQRPRALYEQGNRSHRLRVEHNARTDVVYLSDDDGKAWTVLVVDRPSRRWAVGQARRQRDAVVDAYYRIYPQT